MLTRCPACETSFRVYSEQLKARQGKVRCGECQAVFNALDSLVEEFVLNAPNETEEKGDDATPEWTDAVPQPLTFAATAEAQAAPAEMAEGAEEAEAATAAPYAEPSPEPYAEPAREVITEESFESEPSPEPESLALGTATADLPQQPQPQLPPLPVAETTVQIELPPTIGLTDEAPDVSSEAPAAAPPVSETEFPSASTPASTSSTDSDFVPDLHLDESPHGWGAWLWASGIIFAIALLLVQGLIHFRVDIATSLPATRPLFLTVCSLLGCSVDLPRKIEQLSIENSDLHPDPEHPGKSGRLGLQINLRNRAAFAQTWPHIELTLTDLNERIVLRRMLAADDYLISQAPTAAQLAQGIAAKQDVNIELALDIGELTATGYRLYLFYP